MNVGSFEFQHIGWPLPDEQSQIHGVDHWAMSVCFDLVEFSILDVLGAPGFFEALLTLAWVLECGVTSFPRLIADVR